MKYHLERISTSKTCTGKVQISCITLLCIISLWNKIYSDGFIRNNYNMRILNVHLFFSLELQKHWRHLDQMVVPSPLNCNTNKNIPSLSTHQSQVTQRSIPLRFLEKRTLNNVRQLLVGLKSSFQRLSTSITHLLLETGIFVP